MTAGKTIALTIWTLVCKVTSLLSNMLFRFIIVFLPRSKCLLISWLQSLSTVILEPKKIQFATASTFCKAMYHEVMGPDAMIFVFWMLSCKAAFSFCYFTLIKRLFISSLLSAIVVVSSAYLRLFIFILAILIPACDSTSPQRVGQNWVPELNWTEDNQSPTDSRVFFTSPSLNCLKECT